MLGVKELTSCLTLELAFFILDADSRGTRKLVNMADPLSVASALIAIVTATIQSSKVLYDTIQSFKNNQRIVRQLMDELLALNEVLLSLDTLVQSKDDPALGPLRTPLNQCRKACDDFNSLMIECSKHSGRPRTSFRDWLKVRYMDGDIVCFTSMLAGYKSTIAIALGNANLLVARLVSISQLHVLMDKMKTLCHS